MSFEIARLDSLIDVVNSFCNGNSFISRLFRFLVYTPTLSLRIARYDLFFLRSFPLTSSVHTRACFSILRHQSFVTSSSKRAPWSIVLAARFHVSSTLVIVGNRMRETTGVSFSVNRHHLILTGQYLDSTYKGSQWTSVEISKITCVMRDCSSSWSQNFLQASRWVAKATKKCRTAGRADKAKVTLSMTL